MLRNSRPPRLSHSEIGGDKPLFATLICKSGFYEHQMNYFRVVRHSTRAVGSPVPQLPSYGPPGSFGDLWWKYLVESGDVISGAEFHRDADIHYVAQEAGSNPGTS